MSKHTPEPATVEMLARTSFNDARGMFYEGRISADAWEGYGEVWHDIPRETTWEPTTDPAVGVWVDAIRDALARARTTDNDAHGG